MAGTKQDARQIVLRAQSPFIGNAANEQLDVVFPRIDTELSKLFEDRNFILAGGGSIFNSAGASVTFSASLALHVNSLVSGATPSIIDLGSTSRAFSVDGKMLYAVINRTAATATVTADASSLPAVTASNQEVVLIAKRIGTSIFFRNGIVIPSGTTMAFGDNIVGSVGTTTNRLIKSSGTDGKSVQSTGITVDSSNNVTGIASETVATSIVTGVNQENISNDTATGANATISAPTTPIVRLTSASLTSLDGIPAGSAGQSIKLINATTVPVNINNDTGATTANRILTGTGGTLLLAVNASIIVTYDSTTSKWRVVGGSGSGSGGSSSNDIFLLTGSDIALWTSGNSVTFAASGTLAGTFVSETANPLHGTSSYKYTQATSINDWIASPAQAVDLRFRGQQTYLSFPYQYDGTSTDIQVILYDVTNSTILTSVTDLVIGTNGATSQAIVSCVIPLTCSSIKVGFQVKASNSGKIFSFDDIKLSLDLYNVTNLVNTSFLRFEGCSSRGSTDTYICKFDTQTIYSGTDFFVTNTAANGTVIQMLNAGTISVESTISTASAIFWITKNQATLTTNPLASESMGIQTSGASIVREQVTSTFDVAIGDKIRITSNVTPTVDTWSNFILSFKSQSSAIVTPTQQVSSDTMNFAFKSTAIDSNVDAIGTFNTYTYAANGNTATIATSAPTQTTSSMNVNGIQVFGRAFSSASTSASPSRVDIFIGKGLKSKQVDFYATSAKSTAIGSDNVIVPVNLDERGAHQSYDETTGILSIDVGIVEQGTGYQRYLWNYKNNSSVTSPYFVFNASKAPSIAALPILQPKVAIIKYDTPSSRLSVSGTYSAVPLTSTQDPTGIVSVSSNQIILQKGQYKIDAEMYFQGGGSGVNGFAALQNITTAQTEAYALVTSTNSSGYSAFTKLSKIVTLNSPTTFEIRVKGAGSIFIGDTYATEADKMIVTVTKIRD